MSRAGLLLGCLLVAAAVAGCSTSTAGTPSAAGGTAAAPRLASPITRPTLDASPLLSHPCDLMKPAQLAALGISTSGKRFDVITGPGCRWSPDDFNRIEYAGSINVRSGGLEGIYQRRANYTVFEPVTVAGYPAVHVDQYDERSQGSCQVLAAINDTTMISVINHVTVDGSADYLNACKTADAFAAMIIGNLGGGS